MQSFEQLCNVNAQLVTAELGNRECLILDSDLRETAEHKYVYVAHALG